jgi:hypothetical protein
MPRMSFNFRAKANFSYDANKVQNPPRHQTLMRFTELLWHGEDDDGVFCVYRKDPKSREVVRIEFHPPA